MPELNPRYTCYLQAGAPGFGSGASMHGYIAWITERLAEWKCETGWLGRGLSEADHAAFDIWLNRYVGRVSEGTTTGCRADAAR